MIYICLHCNSHFHALILNINISQRMSINRPYDAIRVVQPECTIGGIM